MPVRGLRRKSLIPSVEKQLKAYLKKARKGKEVKIKERKRKEKEQSGVKEEEKEMKEGSKEGRKVLFEVLGRHLEYILGEKNSKNEEIKVKEMEGKVSKMDRKKKIRKEKKRKEEWKRRKDGWWEVRKERRKDGQTDG